MLIQFGETVFFPTFFHQFNGRTESNEIFQLTHVDAITIRIADLRGGRNDDYFFGLQPGQHPYDTFPQGGAPDNGIIYYDEGIQTFLYGAVSNVVNMLYHFIPAHVGSNECAHLDIFDRNFFNPDFPVDHLGKFLFSNFISPGKNALNHYLFQIIIQALPQSVESHFSRIGNKRKYAVFKILVDGRKYLFTQVVSEGNPFAVNFFIAATRKINAFKAAGPAFLWFQYLVYGIFSI